ncbi:hypothetical protein BDZ94DRAFT_1296211 [Collybia nuda]|uniref:Uncharacterized protein n=1 Tax=Collybia nuda TaxID=64659 RepID=A0A9P5Y977_9AGAR|nr:hypothetical protein BDZ94DRAFT_1296211 [Collybia nuda]
MNADIAQRLQDMAEQRLISSREGDTLFEAGKFDSAKKLYWEQAIKIVGSNHRIPAIADVGDGGERIELYIKLGPYQRANLMGCCTGLARCLVREGDIDSALAWLDEAGSLYKNSYFASEKPLYDWIDYNLDLPELTYQRLRACSISSDIFLSLGNTGAAMQRLWNANSSTLGLPPAHHTPRIRTKKDREKIATLITLRHPDPSLTSSLTLKDPSLQVRGSWLKLHIKNQLRTLSRFSFATFIWNSHLYIAGGQKDSLGPFYRDFLCLDLVKLDGWRALPDYPRLAAVFLNWDMVVHEDKAYLVTGKPRVDFFDLKTEKWGFITTTYKATPEDKKAGVVGGWPYPGQQLSSSAQQVTKGKLLIFGGIHGMTNIGCNLFMELDLKTKVWRRLSGYVMPPPDGDYSCPGPRKSASSWVSRDANRFYLLYGQCDRNGASLKGEPHGASDAFPFEDMWSWDLTTEKWRRERRAGNPPSCRSEMACTYNSKLDKVFVFGGYSPSIPTSFPTKNQEFHFSYYADTFMFSPPDPASPTAMVPSTGPSQKNVKAPKWKQVLTRGFPTYRCQARLMSDSITGKMYLYGGYTNSDYVPSRKSYISRSFGDVWQLRVDEPGGYFEGINLDEEARTAKVGPWQRCFNCGDSGPWKKCGGACKGQAFFCGSECLKDGWKEHKKMHKCHK